MEFPSWQRLPVGSHVAVVNPHEIGIGRVAAAPVETIYTIGRVSRSFDGFRVFPRAPFSMAINEAEGAPIAVKNRENVNPARWSLIEHPRTLIEST